MSAFDEVMLWTLVMVRCGGMMAALPVISTNSVPKTMKLGLSVFLSVLTVPMLPRTPVGSLELWPLASLVLIEVGTGYMLGFVCRFTFFAMDVAGSLVATDLGLSMATMLNPGSSTASPVTATLFYWLGAMLLFALDLHHWILAAFVRTYVVLPIGAGHVSEALLKDILARTSWILATGLQLAAPVMAVSFVITLVFALLGRAVPQMNVFSESMPVRTAAGLFVFGTGLTFVGDNAANYLKRIPDDMVRIAKLLGTA